MNKPDSLASDLRLAVLRLSHCLRRHRVSAEHTAASLGEPQPDPAITFSQLSALSTLHLQGPMTPSALAATERVSRPSTTRLLGCLHDLGLIDRVPDPTDRRQLIIAATNAGAELLRDEIHAREVWLHHRLTGLTGDDRRTLRAAVTLLNHLTGTPPEPHTDTEHPAGPQ